MNGSSVMARGEEERPERISTGKKVSAPSKIQSPKKKKIARDSLVLHHPCNFILPNRFPCPLGVEIHSVAFDLAKGSDVRDGE